MVKRRVYKNEGQPHVDGGLVVSNSNTSGKGVHKKKISRMDANSNTSTNTAEAPNPNTNTNTTDAANLNTATNSVDVPNHTTTSLFDELAEWLNEQQGEQLSSEIPCISIPEREKGRRLKKVDRKVETCTRCDFIVAVFYNGTHDIQTPVVLPYYMERQSEYLLDCVCCKKINRSI